MRNPTNRETIIISLGGSVVIPDQVDYDFLEKFKKTIEEKLDRYRFVIVVGGGALARRYQQEARAENPTITDSELDWRGIEATWENAELVKEYFGPLAGAEIIKDPTKHIPFNDVLFGGGWKPGFTTDHDAAWLAKTYNARRIINISNVDGLYTANPKQDPHARFITHATWKELQDIVGHDHTPGAHTPFDPEAVKLGSTIDGLTLAMMDNDVENLQNYLDGRPFKGTTISNKNTLNSRTS